MGPLICKPYAERSTRSLEHRAFHNVVLKGEPMPLDVAAELMERGFDVERYEEKLEAVR